MALVLADRVRETTTTVGIGSIALAGAATGYQSFSVIGNGNTTYYCVAGQGTSEWEVGIGTYTSSGTTLARTTILSSSNSGLIVNFSAGVKDVFVTYPSEKSVNLDGSDLLSAPAGLGTGIPTFLSTPSSANLAAAVTDETGSGSLVFATSPSLTTPNLGTPSAINLTNATALPLGTAVSGTLAVGNGGTGLSSLTVDRIPYGNGTGAYNSSTALTYNGTVFKVGSTAALSGTTNPIAAFTGAANAYVEAYIYNATAGGSSSADFVAYPDVGVNSSTYSDATFSVTGPNESYVFASAPSGASQTGNLVYATDSTGTANSHQWYVGGFAQAKGAWKMQLTSTGLQLANALAVGYGGTGLTSGTSGGIPYFSSASTIASSAALTANALVVGGGAGVSPTVLASGTSGQLLVSAGSSVPVFTDQFVSITYIFSNVSAGDQGDLTIPFNCTITEWTLLADLSGSAVVDIWEDTYANYPPTVADTITGSAKPTISASDKGRSSTLTGWSPNIDAGNTLRFNVDSVTSITRLTLSLKVKRT